MAEPSWYALHVWSGRECAVASALRRKQVENYLPLVDRPRHWSDRIVTLSEPLFPGYLFGRFNPADRLSILKVYGVYQVLGGDRPTPVPEAEIEQVRLLVDSGRALSVVMQSITPQDANRGCKVRIKAGPLAGVEGVIERRSKHGARIVVAVPILCRLVSAEVDLESLELTEKFRPRAVAA